MGCRAPYGLQDQIYFDFSRSRTARPVPENQESKGVGRLRLWVTIAPDKWQEHSYALNPAYRLSACFFISYKPLIMLNRPFSLILFAYILIKLGDVSGFSMRVLFLKSN